MIYDVLVIAFPAAGAVPLRHAPCLSAPDCRTRRTGAGPLCLRDLPGPRMEAALHLSSDRPVPEASPAAYPASPAGEQRALRRRPSPASAGLLPPATPVGVPSAAVPLQAFARPVQEELPAAFPVFPAETRPAFRCCPAPASAALQLCLSAARLRVLFRSAPAARAGPHRRIAPASSPVPEPLNAQRVFPSQRAASLPPAPGRAARRRSVRRSYPGLPPRGARSGEHQRCKQWASHRPASRRLVPRPKPAPPDTSRFRSLLPQSAHPLCSRGGCAPSPRAARPRDACRAAPASEPGRSPPSLHSAHGRK